MITFRKDQIDAFKSVGDTDFERVLAQRLMESFPRSEGSYGEDAILKLVRLGLERARNFGLEQEEDILRYLGAMLLLGSEFVSDPQLRWAATALATPAKATPQQRVAALWEQTRAYCNRVMGADNRHYVTALRSLEAKAFESLFASSGRSARDIVILLSTMHPQKAQEIGEAAIHDLARFAVETCRTHNMLDRESVALLTVLMFLFGAGLMSDPLTAWAPAAWNDAKAQNTGEKLAKMYAAADEAAARIAK